MKEKRKCLEIVLPCCCDICKNTHANAWGVGGEEGISHARERFVRIKVVEIEEDGNRELAIVMTQPPNCEGSHREQLIFPLSQGIDKEEQQKMNIKIIKEVKENE